MFSKYAMNYTINFSNYHLRVLAMMIIDGYPQLDIDKKFEDVKKDNIEQLEMIKKLVHDNLITVMEIGKFCLEYKEYELRIKKLSEYLEKL